MLAAGSTSPPVTTVTHTDAQAHAHHPTLLTLCLNKGAATVVYAATSPELDNDDECDGLVNGRDAAGGAGSAGGGGGGSGRRPAWRSTLFLHARRPRQPSVSHQQRGGERVANCIAAADLGVTSKGRCMSTAAAGPAQDALPGGSARSGGEGTQLGPRQVCVSRAKQIACNGREANMSPLVLFLIYVFFCWELLVMISEVTVCVCPSADIMAQAWHAIRDVPHTARGPRFRVPLARPPPLTIDLWQRVCVRVRGARCVV